MYHNPYEGKTFLSFFVELLHRIYLFFTGNVKELASDEIQLLVLIGVAISAALVGTFLVLRRMTMLANSLSHTILVGIVITFVVFGASLNSIDPHISGVRVELMLIAALVTSVITAYLTELLTKVARLQEDASTGLIFTGLFALGIVLVTLLTRNAHIGAEVIMGNVDALQSEDTHLVYWVLGLNLLLFGLFFKEYQVISFDPALAAATGVPVIFFNYLLMTQVAATTVAAFRAVGVLMVLALISGPPLCARLLTHDLKRMIAIAVGYGCAASVIGVALSRHLLSVYGLALSTAGIVVCTISVLFVVTLAITFLRNASRQKNLSWKTK